MPFQIFGVTTFKITPIAKDTAVHYIGIREVGINRGPVVSKIIKTAGGIPGQSWCMWFVRYCVEMVCEAIGIRNPMPKNGSCSGQLHYAMGTYSGMKVLIINNYFDVNEIQPGDIFIFKHGEYRPGDENRYWNAHTCFAGKNLGNGNFETIEGNTNKAGSREGDGTYKKIRNIFKEDFPVVAIIRF